MVQEVVLELVIGVGVDVSVVELPVEFAMGHLIDLVVDLGVVTELHLGLDVMVGQVVSLMVDQAFDLEFVVDVGIVGLDLVEEPGNR